MVVSWGEACCVFNTWLAVQLENRVWSANQNISRNQSKLLPVISAVIHAGLTGLRHFQLHVRVTFRCEAKFSDFFLFSVFAYSLDRPVKLPVTLSKSNFFFFVIVLFIRKNVFILLEIILVSCHETIDRYINAKKMSFQNNLWLQTDTRFTLDEAFCI